MPDENPTDELIKRFWLFRLRGHADDLQAFARFLLEGKQGSEQLERDIGFQINQLSRISQRKVREAFKSIEIRSLDEFTLLTSIKRLGEPLKSEACEDALIELPTGVHMVRRMEKAELVEQFPAPNDRRAQCLRLTKAGEEVWQQAFEVLSALNKEKLRTLNEEEKIQLLLLLEKIYA